MTPLGRLLVGPMAAGLLILTAGTATAAAKTPRLLAQVHAAPSSVHRGDTVRLSGSGFTLPVPDTCVVMWNGGPIDGASCDVKGHVVAVLPLPEQTPWGEYTVTLCVPGCGAGKIAGSKTTFRVFDPATSYIPDHAVWPISVTPDPAIAGQTVTVEDNSIPPAAEPGPCTVLWDGSPTSAKCTSTGAGILDGSITVPPEAARRRHTITVCRPDCKQPVGGTAETSVVVRAGVVPPSRPKKPTQPRAVFVLVPDLTGQTADGATSLLSGLSLVAEAPQGAAGTVSGQDPKPGTRVRTGTIVKLLLVSDTQPPTTDAGESPRGIPIKWSDVVPWIVLSVAVGAGFLARGVRERVLGSGRSDSEPEPASNAAGTALPPPASIAFVVHPDPRPVMTLVPRPGHRRLPPLRLRLTTGTPALHTEVSS
jgi:PASTA domain